MKALLSLALLSLALVAPRAQAETLEVPADIETIQLAVDAASDGDTILISPGTYTESVVVNGISGLILRAKGKVIIDTIADAPGLALIDCEDVDVIGLRVIDGSGSGITITGGTLITLERCRVEGVLGDGILASGVASLTLDRCVVEDVGGCGIVAGGLEFTDPCPGAQILKCRVEDEDPLLLGILTAGADVLVDRCRVVWPGGNKAVQCGGTEGGARVERCRLDGAGLVLLPDDCVASKTRVTGEHVEVFGDGTVLEKLSVTGGAIFVSGASNVIVRGCRVKQAPLVTGISVEVALDTLVEDNVVTACLEGVRLGSNCEGGEVSGNVATGCLEVGFHVLGDNAAWTGNRSKGAGVDGFRLGAISGGNTLTLNKATGSGNFDLLDQSGDANDIGEDNVFPKTAP